MSQIINQKNISAKVLAGIISSDNCKVSNIEELNLFAEYYDVPVSLAIFEDLKCIQFTIAYDITTEDLEGFAEIVNQINGDIPFIRFTIIKENESFLLLSDYWFSYEFDLKEDQLLKNLDLFSVLTAQAVEEECLDYVS